MNPGVREAIDRDVLAWTHEPSWEVDEERFDELARRIFTFQFDHCDAYAKFCRASGIKKNSVDHWSDIPAVPTGAFKEIPLRCFPGQEVVKTFRTSGTSTSQQGELYLDTLSLYDSSLWASISRFVFPNLEEDQTMTLRVLAPSPDEQPDSSLSHMFGKVMEKIGDPRSGYDLVQGELKTGALLSALAQACEEGRPIALCGTAFAFVHLVDEFAQGSVPRLELPQGSRIMETGGYKGKSREMPRPQLYEALEADLGVPQTRIINQYGMTELGSQFYEPLIRTAEQSRQKMAPPWTRVRFLDPETGRDVTPGESGIVVIHDLVNTGSIAAIQTADLGRRVEAGFEIEGRIQDAEARGCSIAADIMLIETSKP